jgi:DNA-binding IclR family transcriptional regulator
MWETSGVTKNLTSVTNAVRILRLLGARPGRLGVSDIAEKLDLSTSTTHRVLATLHSGGLVERRNSPIRYGLAPGVAISPDRDEGERLAELARPVMTRLKDAVNSTIHILFLAGDHLEFLAAVESDAMMRVTSRLGRQVPPHLGAAGKVLLALGDTEAGERLCREESFYSPTGRGPQTGAELREQLELVRRLGYGRNLSESEIGMYSIALPLRGYDGKVTYSLTIAGPMSIAEPAPDGELSDVEKFYLHHLQSAVREIEGLLGL